MENGHIIPRNPMVFSNVAKSRPVYKNRLESTAVLGLV